MSSTPQCGHTPSFFVEYVFGSKFYVCDSCIKLKHWSRGIKKKISITNIKNELPEGIVSGRRLSLTQTPQTEVTNHIM